MSEHNKSEQARINGSESKGPTSITGKRWSAQSSFKTGLYAKTIEAFPKDLQDHYHQIHEACRDDYRPADSIEDDLVAQMAFDRTRYFHYMGLFAQNLDNPESLESRRRRHPRLAAPSKIIVQWTDPRTGELWRPSPEYLTGKNEGTNPPTPTKQYPESRQVRRRRERLARRKSLASGDIRDGAYG